MGMASLGRPLTHKEFVIRSLMGPRDQAPTLIDVDVDVDEDEASGVLAREHVESWPELPPPPRDTLSSVVFDLVMPQRDTQPSPPPSER